MAAPGRRGSDSSSKGSKFETRRPARIIWRRKVCASKLTSPQQWTFEVYRSLLLERCFKSCHGELSEHGLLVARAQGFTALVPE